VVVLERRNARSLERAWLPAAADVVTIDVSFISLRLIMPALPAVLAPGADIVALVKPQFEAGRDEVGRGGLVKDPAVHDAVLARVSGAAASCGLARVGMAPSPITGATGNREFLMHLRAAGQARR
jgi:23S rRNA (cytidine1920-2'-O)/16S rRNA (cytidine1409-2'-O)-methyltransferase